MRQLKFRQPIYHRDGSFREWHYWGLFKNDGEWINIAPASRHCMADVKITDPLDSTQFVGLTDKNGVEIYEGDVLKHNDNLFIVWHFYNYGVCLAGLRKFDINRDKLLIKDNWRDLNWLCNTQKYVLIIGNIYEHPHLITQPA